MTFDALRSWIVDDGGAVLIAIVCMFVFGAQAGWWLRGQVARKQEKPAFQGAPKKPVDTTTGEGVESQPCTPESEREG